MTTFQTQQHPATAGPYGPAGAQPAPPPGPAPARRRRVLAALVVALAVVALVAAGLVAWTVGRSLGSRYAASPAAQPASRSAPQLAPQTAPNTAPQLNDAAAIAAAVTPGLVDVNTVLGLQGARAAGTGMVLTSDGEVLTNNYVVEGATEISVTDLGNGRTYAATVVGYDRTHDVAVLQLQGASGLRTVTTGDSDQVSVGDAVLGIGNAGGTGGAPSVAAGTVTALEQTITASDQSGANAQQLTGLIQTNANIQPGDSGGPLVNDKGQVIGMNTAASAGNQTDRRGAINGAQAATTQGFAIPINDALAIADRIESGQASPTVHIGQVTLAFGAAG